MSYKIEVDEVVEIQSPCDEIVAVLSVNFLVTEIDQGRDMPPDSRREVESWTFDYAWSRTDDELDLELKDLPWLTDEYVQRSLEY